MTVISSSTLLTYYSAQQNLALARSSTSSSSSTSDDSTSTAPWDEEDDESTVARDADVLSTTDYVDTSDVPLVAVSDEDKLEQDNQKLFAIYKALDTLQYLSEMAARDDVPSGVIDGYNTRFQECLSQIEDYLDSTTFNNLDLQEDALSAVTTATASISSTSYGYTTDTLATSENINETVSGLTESDSFVISITKNGEESDITINIGDIIDTYGTASLSNIVSYINAKLADEGVNTRFKRVQTGTTTDEDGNTIYQYGLSITYASNETVSLSATTSSTALYLTGTTGLTESTDDTDANSKGRLVKLSLSGDDDDETTSVFSTTSTSDGISTASASVIDDDGNVYVVGTTTGDDEGEINQGSSDVYISKYDSAGNLLWTHLLGSSDSAESYDLALDPTGGVVVVGSTTANLTTTVADDNDNTFVAKFSEDGDEEWVTQLSTRSDNSALSVSVDSSGNVTVGGTTSGVVSSSETSSGEDDAYLLQLDSSGNITARQQYGTSGDDEVAATTYDDDGNLYVVSILDGVATLSKYAVDEDGNVDITSDPTYTVTLGDIGSSGDITDIVVEDGKIYIAGSTTKDLDTTDSYTPSGTDAFVYALTDDGDTATTDFVTYVATDGKETSGTLAVSSDGTVYLSGTTTGTFDGQSRSEDDTDNAFITAIDGTTGSIDWTKQYGGISGQSTGASIAISEDNSSVLDLLGLPTGTVQTSTSSESLTDSTTLKAGDTFQIEIDNGSATRTVTITIDEDETLRSLVSKINSKLGDSGTASITYSSGSKTLEIETASGTTLTLISDSDETTDALAGLGLSALVLSDGTTTTSSDGKTTYGLGLSSDLEFSTQTEAAAVKAQIGNVLSAIKDIYQAINSTDDDTDTTTTTTSTASAAALSYINSRTTNASQALSLLA